MYSNHCHQSVSRAPQSRYKNIGSASVETSVGCRRRRRRCTFDLVDSLRQLRRYVRKSMVVGHATGKQACHGISRVSIGIVHESLVTQWSNSSLHQWSYRYALLRACYTPHDQCIITIAAILKPISAINHKLIFKII